MKPLSRGTVVLATSLGIWACGGDPTDSFRGTAAEITASPASMFITRGATKQVVVEVIDAQGNPLVEDVTASSAPGLTIALDPNYLSTQSAEGPLRHAKAFNVTANDLVSTTFTLTAAGVSRDISVRVVPGEVDIPPATVASTSPNAGEPTTVTVPAPYLFPADAAVTFTVGADAIPGIVTDRAADGRSLTFLAPPGAAGNGTTTIVIEYLPTTELSTTTDVPLAVGTTVAAQAGTDAPATAPVMTLVGGVQGGTIDGNGGYAAATCGGLSGIPCQLYKFTLDVDSDLDVETRWSNEADLGLYIFSEDGLTDVDGCDEHGRGPGAASQPEHCLLHLPAGTYLAGAVNFGPFYPENDPNPDWVLIRLVASQP